MIVDSRRRLCYNGPTMTRTSVRRTRRRYALLALVLCVFASLGILVQRVRAADGAVSIAALDVPVGEMFDTLITAGNGTWINDSTLLAWSRARTGTGNTIVASNGNSGTGNLYSFGNTASTERALGSSAPATSWSEISLGRAARERTGSTITSLTISYTGEQWRSGGGAAGRRRPSTSPTGSARAG